VTASIAAYLGAGSKFDQAIARFSTAYADQNELDHRRLAALSGVVLGVCDRAVGLGMTLFLSIIRIRSRSDPGPTFPLAARLCS
jgi:hypothetical protein